jgi:uncharacterized protein YjiS (DUF1127 family)
MMRKSNLQEAVVSAVPTLHIPRQHSGSFTRGRGALLHSAIGLVTLIAREIRIRRDMRKLARLDDRMLRDIGLTRMEIEASVRYGRSSVGLG